jgi:hypothetical protein
MLAIPSSVVAARKLGPAAVCCAVCSAVTSVPSSKARYQAAGIYDAAKRSAKTAYTQVTHARCWRCLCALYHHMHTPTTNQYHHHPPQHHTTTTISTTHTNPTHTHTHTRAQVVAKPSTMKCPHCSVLCAAPASAPVAEPASGPVAEIELEGIALETSEDPTEGKSMSDVDKAPPVAKAVPVGCQDSPHCKRMVSCPHCEKEFKWRKSRVPYFLALLALCIVL